MLWIIPTPLGHLDDWTYRAVRTVSECDYLLCEDTRRTKKLLLYYSLSTPLVSYHAYSEKSKLSSILCDLKAGQTIGLVSDAGTPAICDPGAHLVQNALIEKIPISALPGPCAITTTLSMSGLSPKQWQFCGFFADKKNARNEEIATALTYPGVTIFYIAPHDLKKILVEIDLQAPDCTLHLFREVTKKFEDHLVGTPQQLIAQTPLKGEMVLMFEEMPHSSSLAGGDERKIMHLLLNEQGMKLSTAAGLCAKLLGKKRSEIYHRWQLAR